LHGNSASNKKRHTLPVGVKSPKIVTITWTLMQKTYSNESVNRITSSAIDHQPGSPITHYAIMKAGMGGTLRSARQSMLTFHGAL